MLFFRIVFGIVSVIGLWCFCGLLKDGLVHVILEFGGARSVLAEITNISRGMRIRFSDDSKNSSTVIRIFTVTCRKDGKTYKAKTTDFLDYTNIGMLVPVYISEKVPGVYRVDLDHIFPPEKKTRPSSAEKNAEADKAISDPPPVRKPCFKWLYKTYALWMFLLSLLLLAFGMIALIDFRKAWPLSFFGLAGLVLLFFAMRKTVRCIKTYVLGDRLNARITSVRKDKKGQYFINLRWGKNRGFSVKKDYVGSALIGTRANVYVSRRNPDIYDVDL